MVTPAPTEHHSTKDPEMATLPDLGYVVPGFFDLRPSYVLFSMIPSTSRKTGALLAAGAFRDLVPPTGWTDPSGAPVIPSEDPTGLLADSYFKVAAGGYKTNTDLSKLRFAK
ncbi:hypothetical protein I316_03090 [Kwoniella heveanensis BCC8398]|uniref:Uncharacterized protein n=1 Tax=Kwoniella heveanensis BCC8398 TaxID=1296120 RepID=A0A1B9GVJ1_9TREE|nr:hypothetical protein I316_03090 [Kwoniella heveanensis BCC8398]